MLSLSANCLKRPKVGDHIHDSVFLSVMVCCYNSEKYIRETLESIANQTYRNWEVVAINDGSTDNTEHILLEYKRNGMPITYFRQKNQGFAAARNKAMELAKGQWIAIIDHDDVCLPKRFEIQAAHIRENPTAKLFFANTIHFHDDRIEIRQQFDRLNPCKLNLTAGKAMNNLLAFNCFIDTESVVFNKQAAMSVGGFDVSYKYVVDYDFFLRMGLVVNFFCSEELVSKWRVHNDQLTQTIEPIIFKEMKQIFYKYFCLNGVTNKTRFKMILKALHYILYKIYNLLFRGACCHFQDTL